MQLYIPSLFLAIVTGSIAVVALGLTMQLALIFVAIGINELVRIIPALTSWNHFLFLSISIPVFFLVMATGGYITASIAGTRSIQKLIINSVIVALITVSLSLGASVSNAQLQFFSLFYLLAAILSVVMGALFWRKRSMKPLQNKNN